MLNSSILRGPYLRNEVRAKKKNLPGYSAHKDLLLGQKLANFMLVEKSYDYFDIDIFVKCTIL